MTVCEDYCKAWPGAKVHYLVMETDDFIVFIDPEIDVDWITSKKFDEQGHNDLEAHNNILNRTAWLESLPTHDLNPKIRLSYKRMLGEAIARSLSHDYLNAGKILDESEVFVKARNEELARFWYLSSSGVMTFIILLCGFLIWYEREVVSQAVGEALFWLVIASVAGATGALLSIIMRMGKTSLDCSAGKTLHQLESVSRIVAGMISAVLACLAVYAEIIFPVFSKLGNARAFLVLISLVAGASERWAPSIIENLEKQGATVSEKKNKKMKRMIQSVDGSTTSEECQHG